ncbi:MAG TPA: 5'-nucleotidase C-terminal domain-containing protein [Clostridium sp.]
MRKKVILSSILSLTLIFSNATFTFAEDNTKESNSITIIHTNDTHGRVLVDDGGFGFGKIATIVKQTKEKNPNTLVVDAGDVLHGMPIINVSKGENAVKILDAVGYDFMVPGNHDFNYGTDRLIELGKLSKFKMLSANLLNKSGNTMLTPYEIVDINGMKVGIFGVCTPETAYKTNPSNVKNVEFKDPIEVSKNMVRELDNKTDVIVALVHIGLDESSTVTSKEIAQKVNGIDVIIDGHSHTDLPEGLVINNTLIAQTGEYDQNLGMVEINIDNHKVTNKSAKLLKATDYAGLAEDKNVSTVVDEIKTANHAIFSEVVASTDIQLDGARENVRNKETNLGNLSADAIKNETKSDIAFVNGGNIRTTIEAGEITKGQLAEVFPFGNTIKVIKLTGKDVKKALEVSVGAYPEAQGGFLQVSGIKFSFDASKENGNRVSELKVNGKDIDLTKQYTVAINDFLAVGGDGYEMLKTKVIAEFGTYEEIFANYLNSNGTKGSEVSGRIAVKETTNENAVTSSIVDMKKTEDLTSASEKYITINATVYTVQLGDVLSMIAYKNNGTWQELAQYNNLKNPDLIFPRDEIKIPA